MNHITSTSVDVATLQAQNRTLQAQVNQLQTQLQQCQYQAQLLEYVQDAIIATDAQFKVTSWNAAATQMYGWSATEALGRPISELLNSDLTPEARAQAFHALQTEGSYTSEALHRHKDGHPFYIEGKTVVLKDSQGQTIGYASVNRDISGRKQTEFALHESESRYRAISGLSSDYAYLTRVEPDGQLVHLWSSENLSALVGYQAEEIINPETPEAFARLFHPDDFPLIQKRNAQLVIGQACSVEFRLITRDGRMLWMRDNAEPVWDEQQSRVIGIRGAVQNITPSKEAENALRESEWRYRALTQLSSDFAYQIHIDPGGQFTLDWISAPYEQLLDLLPRTELRPASLYQFFHPDDHAQIESFFIRLQAGESVSAELRMFTLQKEYIWLQTQNEPVWDECHTRPIAVHGVARNITARKEAEIALQKSNDLLQRAYLIALQHSDNIVKGLRAILQLACGVNDWDVGIFEQVNGKYCVLVSVVGNPEGWQLGQPFPLEQSFTHAALQATERPLTTPVAWSKHPVYRSDLPHALLSLPIFVDGEQLYGTLILLTYTPRPQIHPSEKKPHEYAGAMGGSGIGA